MKVGESPNIWWNHNSEKIAQTSLMMSDKRTIQKDVKGAWMKHTTYHMDYFKFYHAGYLSGVLMGNFGPFYAVNCNYEPYKLFPSNFAGEIMLIRFGNGGKRSAFIWGLAVDKSRFTSDITVKIQIEHYPDDSVGYQENTSGARWLFFYPIFNLFLIQF